MRAIFKLLLLELCIFTFAVQCKTHNSSDKSIAGTTKSHVLSISEATKFDTVNEQLNSKSELMTEDLIALKLIDTTLTTQLSETCYCDTTVHLNDSVYYSVISGTDKAGVCAYVFVASLNRKAKKVVAATFLYPDCDVDYSQDSYETDEHKIVGQGKIEVTNTTVFQKKNRTSPDEEQNIDHKKIQKNIIIISQAGQISKSKS